MSGADAVTGWTLARAGAGSIAEPAGDGFTALAWLPAQAPGTVAGALRAAGQWHEDAPADIDADDWWFRASVPAEAGAGTLLLDGLATIADVWLNGAHVLHSDDMFHEHEVPVEFAAQNELVVCCRALAPLLTGRGPRPRWKTRIVEHQRLRQVRTTLLGRMPGWTVPAPVVGPWRPVRWRQTTEPIVRVDRLHATVADGAARLSLRARVSSTAGSATVRVGAVDLVATVHADGGGCQVLLDAVVPDAALWYPHTHGDPALHDVTLVLDGVQHPLGRVGFRTIEVDRDYAGARGDGFALMVNGVFVHCRGACWMPLDQVTLQADEPEVREALRLVVDAGMNMVRVPGTTVYESELFHSLCDEFGVLVWQDLMFANMQYPADDDPFVALVDREVTTVARRLQRHASTAVICGGSEVEQQAAMMGVTADEFPNRLAREIVPVVLAREVSDVPYVPCSPSGGVQPFSVDTGIGHYFGVGAYLRPFEDARRSSVRFTSECLAFANVPAQATVDELLADGDRAPHAPRWKARVPRDRGSGWDFDDVRDHYVAQCFGVDPMRVRYSDPDRYLELGRAAVMIAMETTLDEFRRVGSTCAGALVLMLRDVWRGAGWGVIDAAGRPKSAYYAIANASAPVAVRLLDEGLNGLVAHVHNDSPLAVDGVLEVATFTSAGTLQHAVTRELRLAARSSSAVHADSVLGAFADLTQAYRFGPPSADVVQVRLLVDGEPVSVAHFLPAGHARVVEPDLGLRAVVDHDPISDVAVVAVSTERFAQFVHLDAPGWLPADDWYHLAPGAPRRVRCRRAAGHTTGAVTGWSVTALNTTFSTSVQAARTEGSH